MAKKSASGRGIEEIFLNLKPGEIVEVPSPFPGWGDEKLVFALQEVTPLRMIFSATYYGIEVGPLTAEYTNGQTGLRFVEEKL